MKRRARVAGSSQLSFEFTGFRFPPDVSLLAVRWFLRFGLSYRDLEEPLAERGVEVDQVKLHRWVQRFTPLLIDAARPCHHAGGDAGSSTRPMSTSPACGGTCIALSTDTARSSTSTSQFAATSPGAANPSAPLSNPPLTRANVVILTTPVDLMGRLSNPHEHLKHLAEQGAQIAKRGLKRRSQGPQAVATAATTTTSKETGRLSNPAPRPVQRRLGPSEIDTIVSDYQAGRSLRAIAKRVGVHHHTVAAHLQRHGIARRVSQRKMTDIDVADASRRYEAGDSLATLASIFSVDPAAIRHELRQTATTIRPRRGRPQDDPHVALRSAPTTPVVSLRKIRCQ